MAIYNISLNMCQISDKQFLLKISYSINFLMNKMVQKKTTSIY